MAFRPPLHEAASLGNMALIQRLVNSGISLHTRDRERQRTPVMMAVLKGHEEVARYLVSKMNAEELAIRDYGHDNVLHHMAVAGRAWLDVWTDICNKCPEALEQKTKNGRRPIDIVRRFRDRSQDQKKIWKFLCKQKYQKGVIENVEETSNITITFIGHEGVGKTCLVKQLLEENIPAGGPGSTNTANLLINHLFVNQKTRMKEKLKEGMEEETGRQRLRRVINRYRTTLSDEGSRSAEDSDSSIGGALADSDGERIPSPEIRSPLRKLADLKLLEKRSLTDEQIKELETYMEAVDVDDEPRGFVTIYDFGGEKVFYNTHHCLLTSDMVYILVFDVAMCLNPETESDGFERIEFWLRSIATYAIDKAASEKGTPPIILIGSHMDLVPGTAEEKDDKFATVLEKLFAKPCIRKIMEEHVQDMFHIGNMNDSSKNKEVYQQIWDKIFDVAPLQSQWKAIHPARWLALEQEFVTKKTGGRNLLTYQEILTINTSLMVPLPEEELKPFLLYLQVTGCMICIGLEGNTPFIILKPRWIIAAFKCIITAPKFKTGLSPKEMLQWKEYERSGKLSIDFLRRLWGKEADKQFLDKEQIICLVMESLGLITKPLPIDVKEEVDFYLVPCMLEKADPDIIQPLLADPFIVMTSALCIEFENLFIPQAIWDKTIAACIHRFQPMNENGCDGLKFIQRGFVCLSVDHKWSMILNCFQNVMKVVMFKIDRNKDKTTLAACGVKLQKLLEHIITKILKMNHQSHLEFDYFLHSDFHFTHNEKRVLASDLLNESPMKCYGCDGTHWLEKADYTVWFEEQEQRRCEVLSDEPPSGIPDRRPTMKEIGRLSRYINGSFQIFFMELGCPSELIDQTMIECRQLSFRSIVTRLLIHLCNRIPDIRLPNISLAMKEHGMNFESLLDVIESCERRKMKLKDITVHDELLKKCLSEEDIPVVVKYIGKSYFNLFLELGFDPIRLEQFDLSFTTNDIKDILSALTKSWLLENGNHATVENFLLAMRESDMNVEYLAEELCRKLSRD